MRPAARARLTLAGLAALFPAIAWSIGTAAPALESAVLAVLLVWLSCADAAQWRLPDPLNAALAAAGLGAAGWAGGWPAAALALLGAGMAALILWALRQLSQTGGRPPGLGRGDIKMGAACGLWAGPVALPFLFTTAALSGLAVAAGGRLAGHDSRRVPFGPGLAVGCWAAWCAVHGSHPAVFPIF